MDLVAIRDIVRNVNFTVHGVDVTVAVEGPDEVVTRGIWLTPVTEDMPGSAAFTRREPIRVIALRRDEVPALPVGTVIVAPEKSGDASVRWVVDGFERQEAHHHRVIVRRQCED